LAPPAAGIPDVVDVNIHGLVALRLVDASAADVAAVVRRVGDTDGAVGGDPDAVVRFVEAFPRRGALRYLGGDAGSTDDAFVVFAERDPGTVVAELRLDGERPELVCQRGSGRVPLLKAIVDTAALRNGALPLHASAFVHRGVGCVVAGWPRGGKTSALLGFMAAGAVFVGDDRVYARPDGSVLGVANGIALSHRHLRELSEYRRALDTTERLRLPALGSLERVGGLMAGRRSKVAYAAGRIVQAVQGRLALDVDPGRLFPPEAVGPTCRLDRLFITMSHDQPASVVEPLTGEDASVRLGSLLRDEQGALRSLYAKARFAFPHWRSSLVEEAGALADELAARLMNDRPAFVVRHPYPPSPSDLYKALRPYCE
jgi:hypothetical protein